MCVSVCDVSRLKLVVVLTQYEESHIDCQMQIKSTHTVFHIQRALCADEELFINRCKANFDLICVEIVGNFCCARVFMCGRKNGEFH